MAALAIAPAACGASPDANTERTTASPSAVVAAANPSPSRAHGSGPVLHGRYLQEYRRMIVALYRVPAARGAPSADPLDELRRHLRRMYGPLLKPDRSAEARRKLA